MNFLKLICLIISIPSLAFGLFEIDRGYTVTATLAVDVIGTVSMTPYIMNPVGDIFSQAPVSLSNESYTFSSFLITDPFVGRYVVGFFINPSTDATVGIDMTNTHFVTPLFTFRLRPTNANDYSVSPSAGVQTSLSFILNYASVQSLKPH